MTIKILAVIPARGNSKSIKLKNITKFDKKPLIEYTIKAAKKSKYIDDLIVSTDNKKIKKICETLNCRVPFLRPSKLSRDSTPTLPVILHAVRFMEKSLKKKYDYILLLQPTSPLRQVRDIDNSIKLLLRNKKFDSIVSVTEVGANHPYRMKIIKKNKLINFFDQGFEDMRPRQKLPKVYIRNGAIYLIKKKTLFKKGSLVGYNTLPYIMKKNNSINIDSQEDLLLARYYLKK